jgi:hypothetical protein
MPFGRSLLEERFALPVGAPRGYHILGAGGGAFAVGPVLFAAADPNHAVKQSSPTGRTNYPTPLRVGQNPIQETTVNGVTVEFSLLLKGTPLVLGNSRFARIET